MHSQRGRQKPQQLPQFHAQIGGPSHAAAVGPKIPDHQGGIQGDIIDGANPKT